DLAFQDYYPDHLSYCYGCGRLNEHGHQTKSYWTENGAENGAENGEETICVFEPQPYHTAIPGYVYGGLLASIIDCHGTGSAAAAAFRAEGRDMDTLPAFRFLTASLKVDYLKPTPLDSARPLRLIGRIREVKGRKVIVDIDVSVDGEVCVRGEVIAVQVPEAFVTEAIEKAKNRG
ncbi:MAG: PaaI family thioesterase, partial [Caldilineaceae bacterium]|nr:PaaI family thioesterase [Caldilineaceae bacterium]